MSFPSQGDTPSQPVSETRRKRDQYKRKKQAKRELRNTDELVRMVLQLPGPMPGSFPADDDQLVAQPRPDNQAQRQQLHQPLVKVVNNPLAPGQLTSGGNGNSGKGDKSDVNIDEHANAKRRASEQQVKQLPKVDERTEANAGIDGAGPAEPAAEEGTLAQPQQGPAELSQIDQPLHVDEHTNDEQPVLINETQQMRQAPPVSPAKPQPQQEIEATETGTPIDSQGHADHIEPPKQQKAPLEPAAGSEEHVARKYGDLGAPEPPVHAGKSGVAARPSLQALMTALLETREEDLAFPDWKILTTQSAAIRRRVESAQKLPTTLKEIRRIIWRVVVARNHLWTDPDTNEPTVWPPSGLRQPAHNAPTDEHIAYRAEYSDRVGKDIPPAYHIAQVEHELRDFLNRASAGYEWPLAHMAFLLLDDERKHMLRDAEDLEERIACAFQVM